MKVSNTTYRGSNVLVDSVKYAHPKMFNIDASYNATALSRLLQSPFPVDIALVC